MSLCANLLDSGMTDDEINALFEAHLVDYKKFDNDPQSVL